MKLPAFNAGRLSDGPDLRREDATGERHDIGLTWRPMTPRARGCDRMMDRSGHFVISDRRNLYHDLHYALTSRFARVPFVDDVELYEEASFGFTHPFRHRPPRDRRVHPHFIVRAGRIADATSNPLPLASICSSVIPVEEHSVVPMPRARACPLHLLARRQPSA